MKAIISDSALVAYCGLYCGACKRYLKEKCPGCHGNEKASWCKVRSCCIEHEYDSCADCETVPNPNECGHFNNFIAKMFAFVFRSDRVACIQQIRDVGVQGHADKMSAMGAQSIKRQ